MDTDLSERENVFSFVWTIDNFFMFKRPSGEYLVSSKFKLNTLPSITCCLELHQNGFLHRDGYISICISKCEDLSLQHTVMWKTRIENSNGKIFQESNYIPISFEDWRYHSVDILADHSFYRHLSSDDLIVHCVFSTEKKSLEQEKILAVDLEDLYKSGVLTDITLSACDVDFKIHRCILAARWPALAETIDFTSGRQTLDISPPVLHMMIKYMYTGIINCKSFELLEKFCEAANQYKLCTLDNKLYAPVEVQECFTYIKAHELNFEWRITDFRKLPLNTTLCTNVFSIQNLCGCYLTLDSFSDNEESRHFQLSLCKMFDVKPNDVDVNSKAVFVRSRITNRSAWNPIVSENENLFIGNGKWNCAELSSVTSDLVLMCEFIFSDMDTTEKNVEMVVTQKPPTVWHLKNYLKDLQNLLSSGLSSDVTIKVGSEIFPVHRAVLYGRSKAFCEMLGNEQSVLRENISLSGLDPAAFRIILDYIYFADMEKFNENLNLCETAYQLGIKPLERWFTSTMASNLTTETVYEFLKLTKILKDNDLYRTAKKFLYRNCDEILRSKEWFHFAQENKHFALKLLINL